MKRISHGIAPVFDKRSRVLILGSFPSPKSREAGFFYGHPQNRFWQVLSSVLSCELPASTTEKRRLLLQNRIALWDVIESCEIDGASDSSIQNAVANDFSRIFTAADISAVFTTGKKATELYKQLTGNSSIYLPSPSPANRAVSMTRLFEAYSLILKYI